eukprot:g1715.t1
MDQPTFWEVGRQTQHHDRPHPSPSVPAALPSDPQGQANDAEGDANKVGAATVTQRKRRMSSREIIAAAEKDAEASAAAGKERDLVEGSGAAPATKAKRRPSVFGEEAEKEDETVSAYALAVSRNHSSGELKVLVDVLSMIKSLASLLKRAEGVIAPVLRLHVHREIQRFVQHTLLMFLYKAQKHKREDEMVLLLQMRRLAADWLHGVEHFEDYKSADQ